MYFKRMLAIGALMAAGITGSLLTPDDAEAQRRWRRSHRHHHGHYHHGHYHRGYYARPYSYYYRPYYYGNYYRYPYYYNYGRGIGIGRGGIYIGW